jgi:UMF1 family MFS transporter
MGITVYAFFIDSALEFWIMGFAVALVLGGSQTASRSLFGSMVPEGKYGEFFGFYTLSHKFSSIMGPFLFALIADVTGSERASILVLNILFLAGLVLLLKVDVLRGRERVGLRGTGYGSS